MKIGSQEHKELFCHRFTNSHLFYQPEKLPWPELDEEALTRLRSIPFWREALYTERQAGVMVAAYAKTVEDPLLREAIALQAKEEIRHARLIAFMLDYYDIKISPPETTEIPHNIERGFIDFGFGECLDSFFAFGMFGIARQSGYFPEALFTIFDPILDEEARHNVFFVNWITYLLVNRGLGFFGFRGVYTFWNYCRAIVKLAKAFGGAGDREEQAFIATGANSFMDNLTLELFFSVCLQENAKRMSVFDSNLLQPKLLPQISQVALSCIKLLPKQKPIPVTQ